MTKCPTCGANTKRIYNLGEYKKQYKAIDYRSALKELVGAAKDIVPLGGNEYTGEDRGNLPFIEALSRARALLEEHE